ncbi:MAG: hypothetical protein FWF26_04495 [Treponema sp.]|nr:hypothetical protein [Treponema sp.]
MSEAALPVKLDVMATLKDGIAIGSKNIGPILVNVILWVVTIWIPYLNVGTTIGLMVGIVSKASKGEAISYTEIFESKYRKNMGEFFLAAGLVCVGVWIGTIFFIIPGIVIGLAWSLTILLVIDKGKNPTEAITLSNSLTYGFKWRIFGVYFITGIVFFIVQLILMAIARATHSGGFISFMTFIVFLTVLFEVFVFIGLRASVYKQLADGV